MPGALCFKRSSDICYVSLTGTPVRRVKRSWELHGEYKRPAPAQLAAVAGIHRLWLPCSVTELLGLFFCLMS